MSKQNTPSDAQKETTSSVPADTNEFVSHGPSEAIADTEGTDRVDDFEAVEGNTEPLSDDEDTSEHEELSPENLRGALTAARKDAASYRTRLRDEEQKTKAYADSLRALQNQAVMDAIPSDYHVTPKLFAAEYPDSSVFMSSDGTIDRQKVRRAADELSRAYGLVSSPRMHDRPSGGLTPRQGESATKTWQDVVRNAADDAHRAR